MRSLNKFDRPLPKGLQKSINLFLVGFIVLIAFVKLFVVSQPQFVQAYEQTIFPVEAVNWLKDDEKNNGVLQGNLFNAYAWGGYLSWAFPEEPVFVDGRTDLFGDEIIGEWLTVVQADEGWQEILDRWQVGTVLVEPDRPVVSVLAQNGWNLVYEDDVAVVYQKGQRSR